MQTAPAKEMNSLKINNTLISIVWRLELAYCTEIRIDNDKDEQW